LAARAGDFAACVFQLHNRLPRALRKRVLAWIVENYLIAGFVAYNVDVY